MADTTEVTWEPGRLFLYGNTDRSVPGLVYRGLGLRMIFKASPKGRRPPMWLLQHLGTGHSVCFINLHADAALRLATEIAECGDWSFTGLRGWINLDPDLEEKLRKILRLHPKAIVFGGGGQSEEFAMAVAMARA